MSLLYSLFVSFTLIILRLASPFSTKIRKWLEGRKNWRAKLKASNIANQKHIVWFHCASLGEFEQAKPVMMAVRKEMPEYAILLTFFSPSGYEARKTTEWADFVTYLPADTRKNARDFVKIANPTLAIFVKSEIWPHYMTALAQAKTVSILFSARFYEGQLVFKINFFKKSLKKFSRIFVQDKASQNLLQRHNIENLIAGDTRFDQVLQLKSSYKNYPKVEEFVSNTPTLVVGSCWPQDIEVLKKFVNDQNSRVKIILAPHDISDKMIKSIVDDLSVSYIKYSKINSDPHFARKKVLIIDNIGMLAHIYQYAQVAYVGGAFKQGLHNILEPAVYGIPIIFGPNTKGFPEALEILIEGCAFSVKNETELNHLLSDLFDEKKKNTTLGKKNLHYVESKAGATEKIMQYILKIEAENFKNT